MATFTTKPLQEAIQKLKGIAPGKGAAEAQKGILYVGNTLLASNTEMALAIASDMTMLQERFIIPNKAFDLIGCLTSDEIEISVDGTTLTIKSGKIKNTFTTFPVEEYVFPQAPKMDVSIGVEAETFLRKLTSVLFAVDEKCENKVLTGVYLEAKEGKLTMVGCNMHAITVAEMPCEGNFTAIVPKKALVELLRSKIKGKLVISPAEKGITFSGHGISLYARKLEGEYINYRAVIKEGTAAVKLERSSFLAAVKRVKAVSSGEEKKPVVFNFTPEGTKLSLETSFASYNEELDIKLDAKDEIRIGFNPLLLEQSISGLSADEIEVELTNSTSPISFKEEGLVSVLLPVNLRQG